MSIFDDLKRKFTSEDEHRKIDAIQAMKPSLLEKGFTCLIYEDGKMEINKIEDLHGFNAEINLFDNRFHTLDDILHEYQKQFEAHLNL
ncbi:hypothetical protein Gbth_119_002 [Gluconobacter thailandicus F149-1 = NBRC 100600]|nr:hypothetical protein [Gluconobacter thailandicus]KXV55119.1 hypothetical protein AD946_00290 [Gluconobacter thailandicus]GAN94861.1 hypothetical protein Gbth_119_002 [Gluconobacter thailandicus F149-1 = NBRC 100600]GBR60094.1 hypothetical protein AA100600_1716 [Gluconobacter thailandicus F149-1 = NBRC 100600]GEL88742.1 hypothetical protein GTH01_31000 [Gluconobacter thailandicus F149-1 = NBRC 100600]